MNVRSMEHCCIYIDWGRSQYSKKKYDTHTYIIINRPLLHDVHHHHHHHFSLKPHTAPGATAQANRIPVLGCSALWTAHSMPRKCQLQSAPARRQSSNGRCHAVCRSEATDGTACDTRKVLSATRITLLSEKLPLGHGCSRQQCARQVFARAVEF